MGQKSDFDPVHALNWLEVEFIRLHPELITEVHSRAVAVREAVNDAAVLALNVKDLEGVLKVRTEQVKALREQVLELRAQVATLRQAHWDGRKIGGFDNDGDPTPDAVVSDFAELILDDWKQERHDYDAALAESTELEAKVKTLTATLEELTAVVNSLRGG